MRILRPLLATVLVAGAFTALGPAAYAASGTSTYTCTGSGLATVPMAATLPDLPDLPAGAPVSAGSLNLDMIFTLTDPLASLLSSVTGLSLSGMSLGGLPGGIPIQNTSLGSLSGLSLPATATNGDFALPAPGSYSITMPTSFQMVGSLSGTPFDITCLTNAPTQLGTFLVSPNSSRTQASLVHKRIPRNHAARVRVTVTRQFGAPADGRVKVKKGTHRIAAGTLSGGSVTIRTPKFKKPGRYVLRVRYVGDQISSGSSDKVVVRVLRRR